MWGSLRIHEFKNLTTWRWRWKLYQTNWLGF